MMMKSYNSLLIALLFSFAASSSNVRASGKTHVENSPMLPDTTSWFSESGVASYYGAAHQGRLSANGTRFDQMALTAAHPWLPFGTKVKVNLAGTDRWVIVTITDRLHSRGRIVDLSLAAARQLGMIRRGIAEVTLSPA